MSRVVWFVLAVFAASLGSCSSSGGTVAQLTITNPTSYDLEIRATNAKHADWVLLGRVQRGETSTEEQVDDLGKVWIFRFDYPGPVFGGELRVSRDELVRSSWKLQVPKTVDQRLRSAGIPASPP
jgi:hypothetical protein